MKGKFSFFWLPLILFFLVSPSSFSQDNYYKKYSFSEFLSLIQSEKDSIFRLKDALIYFDSTSDSLFELDENIFDLLDKRESFETQIEINKEIVLQNVQFKPSVIGQKGVFKNIRFNQPVSIFETFAVSFVNCIFDQKLIYRVTDNNPKAIRALQFKRNLTSVFLNSQFNKGFNINIYSQQGKELDISQLFISNTVKGDSLLGDQSSSGFIRSRYVRTFYVHNNSFQSPVWVLSSGNKDVALSNNQFDQFNSKLSFSEVEKSMGFRLTQNNFNQSVFLEINDFKSSFDIDYEQFNGKLISLNAYDLNSENIGVQNKNRYHLNSVTNYLKNERFTNKSAFKSEIALRGQFYKLYKDKMDIEFSNEVYVEIKELETERTKILHEQDPSFNTFFKWRINQFLKTFSNYGTEPERAIIFSMYVILFFSIIYLFFPNTWDVHGKKRIINRYTFFFTYMNQKAGIHEVYLESKKADILEFNDFKTLLEKQGQVI